MTFLTENWYLIIAFLSIGSAAGCLLYKYLNLPTDRQLDQIREWLLYAVIMAENKFGNKTGQVKLRAVYDMFITKFPSIAKILSFNIFSSMVDDALEKMKDLLKSNDSIKNLIDSSSPAGTADFSEQDIHI